MTIQKKARMQTSNALVESPNPAMVPDKQTTYHTEATMTLGITSPQQRQISRLILEVVETLGLSRQAAQRLLAQGGVFKDKLKPIIIDLAAEKPPCMIHAPELIPKGWTVIEDVEPTPGLDITKLKLIGFLEAEKPPIGGDKMRQRAVKLNGNLGLSDAKYFLANQDKIPVELRGKHIVLPGTVLLANDDGNHFVPFLLWNAGCWRLYYHQIDVDEWDGDFHLVCSE